MKKITPIFLLAALSACAAEMQDGAMKQELYLPLVYADWTVQKDAGHCIATTGHKGLSVIAGSKGTAPRVKGNWPMQPGMEFLLNVGGHTYRSSSGEFSPAESEAIIGDLRTSDKAYLEWTNSNHVQHEKRDNIIKLDGFAATYDACRKAPATRRKRK